MGQDPKGAVGQDEPNRRRQAQERDEPEAYAERLPIHASTRKERKIKCREDVEGP